MNFLTILSSNDVIAINKMICNEQRQESVVLSKDRVESALHSAFYPGSSPFAHGGTVKLAGALLYYICSAHAFKDGNKRTAVASAFIFLESNGWSIKFPLVEDKNIDHLADLTLSVASSKCSKDDCIQWFENHKVLL